MVEAGKLIVAANHKPEVRGTDKGIWRRIKIVPWEVMIPAGERDPQLPRKLEKELEGILAWAVQGCLDWQREGLAEPTEVTFQTEEYQKDQDILAHFIYDECIEGPELFVKSNPLYIAYKEWCERAGEFKLTQTKFSTRLKERGYVKEHKRDGVRWYGIALKSDSTPPGDGSDPSRRDGLTLNPSHAQSGVDKPNSGDEREGCEGLNPKIGLNVPDTLANSVLSGKTLHTPSHPSQPFTLITSDHELQKALTNFGGSR